ncbi:MAG: ABC transporter permease [Atopobiaceae bacterium]|nr:ABC transporter permease [Atopobiaceae bacterium]
MVDLNKYLPPFGFFIALVFVFIVSYASRMLVRRRKRELAFYRLMGMSRWRVGGVLFRECLIVAAVSLAAGIAIGIVLSPLFGAVTAYAFATPWRLSLSVSPTGCVVTVLSFVAISLFSGMASRRELRRHGIAELMRADREVETIGRDGEGASGRSLRLGLVLLGIVYLCCAVPLLQAIFLVFLIPMCGMACLGTYLVLRYLASHLPRRLRSVRPFYLHGLNCFVMRQVESKIRATCGALTWVSALLAVGICLVAMGIGFRLAFDVAPVSPGGLDALSYAPVSFVGIYYGMTFVVAACAILALHQLSEAQDNAPALRLPASPRLPGRPAGEVGAGAGGDLLRRPGRDGRRPRRVRARDHRLPARGVHRPARRPDRPGPPRDPRRGGGGVRGLSGPHLRELQEGGPRVGSLHRSSTLPRLARGGIVNRPGRASQHERNPSKQWVFRLPKGLLRLQILRLWPVRLRDTSN